MVITKEVEGSKEPALTAESEDTCPRNVEDLAIITIKTEITVIVMVTETIIIGDGIIIEDNQIETTRTTGTIIIIITHLLNSNNGNNRTIITPLTISRQTMSNQKIPSPK